MNPRQSTFIALLRGINVGGHNKLPMPELRTQCARLGWGNIQTYIQSGNVVFTAASTAKRLEDELERAIAQHFDLSISVVVRAAKDWPKYIKGNPFPEASEKEPHLVMLALSKAPPVRGALATLRERVANGEELVQTGDALWVYFKGGVARSKLSPAVLDRLVGSPVTTRNWRTVLKLGDMAAEPGGKQSQ